MLSAFGHLLIDPDALDRRERIDELRRELAEIRGIASEAGDHALHVRNLIDSSDGEIL